MYLTTYSADVASRSDSYTSRHKGTATADDQWGRRLTIATVLAWACGFVFGFEIALTVIAGIGFAAAIVGIKKPVIGILGVGLLCTVDALLRVYLLIGGIWRWNTFNYLLLVVILVSAPFLWRLRDPHSIWLKFFIVYLSAGLLISPSQLQGVQHILGIVIVFGLLRYFANVVDKPGAWYWMGILNGAAAGLGSLVFFIHIDSLRYINPNAWSYFPLTALFSICLAFPAALGERKRQLALGLLAVLNFVWVFMSASRGGMLIAVVCLIYLVIRVQGLSRRWVIAASLMLLLVAAVTLFGDRSDYALHRISRSFDTTLSLESRSSGRSDLVRGGIEIFRKNPLGIGTGGFASVFATSVADETVFGVGERMQAHSAWIKTLGENGIPGLVLLSGFIFSFAWVAISRRSVRRYSIGIMVCVVLSLAFITAEFQGKGLWLLVGGAIVLLHPHKFQGRPRRYINGTLKAGRTA